MKRIIVTGIITAVLTQNSLTPYAPAKADEIIDREAAIESAAAVVGIGSKLTREVMIDARIVPKKALAPTPDPVLEAVAAPELWVVKFDNLEFVSTEYANDTLEVKPAAYRRDVEVFIDPSSGAFLKAVLSAGERIALPDTPTEWIRRGYAHLNDTINSRIHLAVPSPQSNLASALAHPTTVDARAACLIEAYCLSFEWQGKSNSKPLLEPPDATPLWAVVYRFCPTGADTTADTQHRGTTVLGIFDPTSGWPGLLVRTRATR